MNFEYGDKIIDVIKNAEEKNKEIIKELAVKFAENIENDKVIHTFGTGHSHMLGIELFARAGGLGNVDAMLTMPSDIQFVNIQILLALENGIQKRACVISRLIT